MATSFEWDENKNRANRKKHGIGFDTAVRVFLDPNFIQRPERVVGGEERWQTVGSIDGGFVVVLVAHTIREEGASVLIRIISARNATPRERRLYGKGDWEN